MLLSYIFAINLKIRIVWSANMPVWNYDEEHSWPGFFCRIGGMRQSPIDIKTTNVIVDYRKEAIKYGPLVMIGYEDVLVSGINNGHTIQFSSEGEEAIHPILTGGPLEHKYRLEQLHFHWLSEHSVDGAKYPMEIHLVHVRTDLSVKRALKEKDGLAILAIFCTVQSELHGNEKSIADEFIQHIPKILHTGQRISGVLLNVSKLLTLTPVANSYYTYAGSLTSPECNEAVLWIIFERPISISDAQYRLFGKVGIGRHNFRSLQTNHQKVYRAPSTYIETPVIVQVLSEFFGLVNKFVKNITTFVGKALTVGP